MLPPGEAARPPPKSTVPGAGTSTIGCSESSNAYLPRSNLSPETVTSMLPSVMKSTTFAAIVLSPVDCVKVTDGADGSVVGVEDGYAEGDPEGDPEG